MAEFIRLDEQEQEAPILPDYPHSISNIKPDTKIIDGVIEKEEVEGICADYDVITIDKIDSVKVEEEGVDHICIKDDCDTSKYYGCTGGDDGFQKENLFSELTDEYQRTIARINLGIADEYALKWGNIKGNLSNQKDLYTFVTDSIAFDINKVIDEINLKLAQWACEIEIRFKNKADIFSPSFAGTPTTTLPLMTDNSNRIASTEWVNAKIAAASIDDNVKAISLDPEYMCYGDEPTDVKVTWEYHKEVVEQSINGVTLSPEVREYTFTNRTTSMVVTLKYKYEDISATRVVTFDIKYPNYFGTSPDYTKLDRTIDNVYTVNAGANEYIYVMIPNGSNTVLGVSSIIGGFKLLGTQEIFSNLYYIFKSAQAGLGETTVEILDQSGYNPESIDTTTIRELLAAKADKHTVYTKEEVDDKLAAIEGGDIELNNYYTKQEVDAKIPDVSGKADKSEIPTKVSQLENDSEYLTEVPKEYVTDKELEAKGYLTQELEPQFAASAAKNINQQDIDSWNNKVDKQVGMGLSEQSFTIEEKAKLSGLTNYNDSGIRKTITDLEGEVAKKANKTDIPDISGKADKSELFSKDYNDLTNTPLIPSIEGLATENYVNEAIDNIPSVDLSGYALKSEIPDIDGKVDKVLGKGLSTNDYTNNDKSKLESLANYDDSQLNSRIDSLQLEIGNNIQHIEKELYLSEGLSDYFTPEEAYNFIISLSKARIVTLEYATLKFVVAFRKVATNIVDTDNIRTINVVMMFHYDELQDLKLTFTLVKGDTTTYEFNKEFIVSTTVGTEALVERLTALENLVNSFDLSKTIVLE